MIGQSPLLFASVALLVLGGCRTYAERCADGDPSLTPEECWNAGYDAGFVDAKDAAYAAAYDEGYAACEEDLDAAP